MCVWSGWTNWQDLTKCFVLVVKKKQICWCVFQVFYDSMIAAGRDWVQVSGGFRSWEADRWTFSVAKSNGDMGHAPHGVAILSFLGRRSLGSCHFKQTLTHTHKKTKRWEGVRRFDSKSSVILAQLSMLNPSFWFVTEVESGKSNISEATGFRLQSAAGNGASSDSEEDQGEPMVHLKICILIWCILIIFYSFGREIQYGVRRTLQALHQQPGSQAVRMPHERSCCSTGNRTKCCEHVRNNVIGVRRDMGYDWRFSFSDSREFPHPLKLQQRTILVNAVNVWVPTF